MIRNNNKSEIVYRKQQDEGKFSKFLKFLKRFGIILATILYIIFVPTLVILFVPIYILRFVVSQARKIFRPDLHKLVNTRSAVLCSEDLSKNPRWNLVIWLTQDGIQDLEKFRRDFMSKFVLKKNRNGELSNPEYQQHFQNWFGFQFWRWEDDFDINEHIRLYDGKWSDKEYVDDNILVQILKELTWKPWENDKSPWEFLQIPNYRPKVRPARATSENVSIMIFRLHHGFGDGYYILKLLMEDICGISLERAAQPNFVQYNLIQKIFNWICFWARAPYQFLEMMFKANDNNEWHVPCDQLQWPMNAALTEPIPLSLVKEIKNAHKVSFTAVITAAITGGIRNLMIERCVEVPKDMTTGTAVPMPGHPKKPRNHFIFSFLGLPVGISDPVEHMMGPFNTNYLSTVLMSNFPGSPSLAPFREVNLLDMMFMAGLGLGNTSIGFTMTSYIDHIRIMSQGDPSIFATDQDVEELNQKIIQELYILRNISLP